MHFLYKICQDYTIMEQRTKKTVNVRLKQGPEAIQKLYDVIDCGNLLCIEFTENTALWNEVRVRNRAHFFCSEPCYHEWLDSPQYQSFSVLDLKKNSI